MYLLYYNAMLWKFAGKIYFHEKKIPARNTDDVAWLSP